MQSFSKILKGAALMAFVGLASVAAGTSAASADPWHSHGYHDRDSRDHGRDHGRDYRGDDRGRHDRDDWRFHRGHDRHDYGRRW